MVRFLRTLAVSTLVLGLPLSSARGDHASPAAGQASSAADAIAAARRELQRLGHRPGPDRQGGAPLASPELAAGVAVRGGAPAPRPDPARPGPTPPAPWLRGLVLPDFPVRWDEQLVETLDHYRSNPRGQAHIKAWLKRSGRYAPMVRRKLKAAGLPQDLLFVPMVESGFDPGARSGAGAVGMWQFVGPTAQEYGLRVDRWADQRVSPEHATDAAIRFLSHLHGRLGSWPLSIAAFNMGYGALQRAMRKYNTNDFWVLANLEAGLPYETVTYVAKITACAIVAKNPERFGLAGTKPDAPRDTALVRVPGGVAIGPLARAAGLSTDKLASLNPELKRRRLPPDARHWDVRLPKASLQRFRTQWKAASQAAAAHRKHVVRLGESLADIASLYGTTEARLRQLNDLQPKARVRPGAVIRVPDVQPTAESTQDDKRAADKPVVAVPKIDFKYPNRKRVFYAVRARDTLAEAARFLGVSVAELLRWNHVSPDANLVSGMHLQAFVPRDFDLSGALVLPADAVETLAVGTEAFFNHHEARQDRKRIRYRTRKGDTLASIAERFGLSVGSIARINRFSRYSRVEPNAELILYVPNKR